MIPASRAEVTAIQKELRPAETVLHNAIAQYHLGGAIYEGMDGDNPDPDTIKKAAPHFEMAAAGFKKSREITQKATKNAELLRGSEAFVKRMGEGVKILESLEANTQAMADQMKGGKLAGAENCYAAASDLTRLATRMQENAHAYRLRMAAKTK